MNKKLFFLVAVAAVAVVGFFAVGGMKSESDLGGSLETIQIVFGAGLKTSALSFSDKTKDVASGSFTFTAADVCDNFLVNHDGDGYASTQPAKWPTGTTLISKCLKDKGDTKFLLYRNTSVDEITTLTGGTNSPLKLASVSSTGIEDGKIQAGNDAFLKFINVDGSNVNIYVEEYDDD